MPSTTDHRAEGQDTWAASHAFWWLLLAGSLAGALGEATLILGARIALHRYTLFNPQGNAYMNPRDVAQVWIDEFDRAHAEGTMFLLTMHPHISGHRSRIVALEKLIAHIKTKPGVWWGTHRAAAEYVKAQAGMR